MTKSRKSQVMIAVAAASLAGAGAAVAESSHTHSLTLSHGLRAGGPGGMHGDHSGGPHGRGLEAAATYLGLSESALQTQLQSGKTLGEIADATAGKSKAGLIAALVADETANIEARVTDLVNGKLPPP